MPRDPNLEYPLLYRLAQFLMGAGDSLGQYSTGLQKQSTTASDVLESQGRQDLQTDVLAERRREAVLKDQERAQAQADKQALIQKAAQEEQGAQTFLDRLAPPQFPPAPGMAEVPTDPLSALRGLQVPKDIRMEALKHFLLPKPKDTRAGTIAPGHGVLNRKSVV